MFKISKAIFRSLLSSRSLCVAVVALMVLCALPVFRSAAGIDGRVEYLEQARERVRNRRIRRTALIVVALTLVVLFQPEFRRALEHIGRGNLFDKSVLNGFSQEDSTIVSELQLAITDLAKRRVGALIVIEQKTALGDIAATGTRIDGVISAPLVENIFEPNTPLHDGAMIIRDRQIIAAACILPLAENMSVARELGTRHRAALGISTVSDSITIVVSEETGVISYARDGKLVRYVDNRALKDLLETIFVRGGALPLALLKRRVKNEEKH